MNNNGNNKPAQQCTDMAGTPICDAENFAMKLAKSSLKSMFFLFVMLLCFSFLETLFFPIPCDKTDSSFTSDLFGALQLMMLFVFAILYERRYLLVALKDRLIMRGFTVVEVLFSDIKSCKIITKRFKNIF